MKKTLFFLTAFTSFYSITANSGNMWDSMGAESANSANWTGFYAGVNGGYAWSNTNTDILPLPVSGQNVLSYPLPFSLSGGGLGAQGGYNWQIKSLYRWVLGLEADIQWLSLSGSAAGKTVGIGPVSSEIFYNDLSTQQSSNWFGTIRPRIGYLLTDSVLMYGTGGFAYGNMKVSGNTHFYANAYGYEGYPASQDKTDFGWTAGAGLEWAVMALWSIKAEYLYYDLGSVSMLANPTIPNPISQIKYTWSSPKQLFRLGANYRF